MKSMRVVSSCCSCPSIRNDGYKPMRCPKRLILFPPASAVEGIKSVPSLCVCVCVCQCVCERFHGWTVWHTDLKFGGGIDLDNISDEFECQGHRLKVEKRDFRSFRWVNYTEPVCHDIWRHVTSWYHIMTSRHDVLTPFDDFWARILAKRARRGRVRQCSGVFINLITVSLLNQTAT